MSIYNRMVGAFFFVLDLFYAWKRPVDGDRNAMGVCLLKKHLYTIFLC